MIYSLVGASCASLIRPYNDGLPLYLSHHNHRSSFPLTCWSTYLHLVDVGGVVSLATRMGNSLTAAIRDHSLLCRDWWDVHAVRPILGVVAATAFKLDEENSELGMSSSAFYFQGASLSPRTFKIVLGNSSSIPSCGNPINVKRTFSSRRTFALTKH